MKVLIIISNINRWMTFEWMAKGFNETFELHFILLNPGTSYFEDFLIKNEFKFDRITHTGKGDIPKSIYQTFKLIRSIGPSIVHTHFLDANLVGLTAARLAGVPKRIHTRHHSIFHHRYSKKGVLYDRWANWHSTHIVAISKLVCGILTERENVPKKKIKILHHGFELDQFVEDYSDFLNLFRQEHNIPTKCKVIGVISRYIDWKGVSYVIEAFKDFHEEHPDSFLLLLNARGPDKEKVTQVLNQLPNKSFLEIEFEENILAVYQLLHVFVHAPIDEEVEAFGQVYVEALASGVPSIFTKSGIASDFIEHEKNALLVAHKNKEEIRSALTRLWGNPVLRKKLISHGKESVKVFSNDQFYQGLKELYED